MERLIKDNVTDWCLLKTKMPPNEPPCVPCTTDGMCTKKDINTGEIKHTFMNGYKKEHRVTR